MQVPAAGRRGSCPPSPRETAIRPETRSAGRRARHGVDPADEPAEPPTGPVDLRRADPPTESFAPGAPDRPAGDRHAGDRAADEGIAGDGAADDRDAEEPRAPTLMEQMGGVSGIIASGVPVVVFVVVQALFGNLVASIATAVGAAVAVAVWRFVRGDAVQPALSGLLGVAVCAVIAWRTGEAKGFFLLGIWTSLVYGGVFLLSVIVRRPLVGVVWHLVNGEGQDWRRDPRVVRAYDLASLAWVVVFGARFVVQRWLYDSVYAETWLGWVRIAMGVPLAALAAAVTVWAIRRSRRAAPGEPERAPTPRRSTGTSRA